MFAALVVLGLLPAVARPDAGMVLLRETRGPLVVALMAGPVPLRAGDVELEALVQSRTSGAPDLEATSTLRLSGPHGQGWLEAPMRPGTHGNRFLQGARVDLRHPGAWRVVLVVHDAAGREEHFETVLHLAKGPGPSLQHWIAIAAGPAGLALLALHQALSLARRTPPRRFARVGTSPSPRQP
jgi:hypothetical protein